MSGQPNHQSNHMDTSQQIRHVFACHGPKMHINPGFVLLRKGDISKCPDCGAEVYDATDTLVGQAYIAFARIDLGNRPS
jgi:uncharacterized paraquat-inducible protein A